jgi:hypothetical protein
MSFSKISAALCLMAAIILGSSPASAEIIGGYLPSGLLQESGAQMLPFDAKKAIALEDAAYVIGTGKEGPQIARLDAEDLQISASRSLDLDPWDVIAQPDSGLLYVIGTQDSGQTRLVVLDRDLDVIGGYTAALPLAYPVLSLASGNRLLVGGLPTVSVEGALLALDLSNPADLRPIPALMPDTYNLFGIAGAWLDDSATPTLFVNAGLSPTLVAAEISEKGISERSDLSFDDGSYEQPPLTVLANVPGNQCPTEAPQSTFLVASNINQSLSLALFTTDFKSLDVISRTELNLLPAAGFKPTHYEGSKVLAPTRLIGSSCDMGVVWISDRNALQVEQFAVNPNLMTLEKVGEIPLPKNPSALAVSPSGDTAYILSAKAQTLTQYRAGDGAVSGTANARTLQRLLTERGFSVGIIDGQIGVKTMTAVTRFEERNNVILDLKSNFDAAIETLKNVPIQ